MRLPQSSSASLSFRNISRISLLVLITLVFLCGSALCQELSVSPGIVAFGRVVVGQQQSETVVLSNSGKSDVTISALTVSSSEFTVSGVTLPLQLAAGSQATATITFAPKEVGYVSGDILLANNNPHSSLKLLISGAGAQIEWLQAVPSSVNFGNMALGATNTVSVVVTNQLSSSTVLKGVREFGNGFSVSGPTFPLTLNRGQSITLKVTFSPTGAGPAAGGILVEGASLDIPLTGAGAGIGQLNISPASLSFGSVSLGGSSTDTFSLAAVGGNVIVSSATSSNGQFTISGASFPLTVTAGQSVPLKLTFTPSASAASSATLTFNSNASDPVLNESAGGTGTAPFVSLSWSPSTSQVSGYNIYRGTAPGVYARLNASLDVSTTYVDNTVAPGATYYYSATAVNSSGQESGYSSPIQVSIP